MFAFASLCFERAWNLTKFGMAMAARMPMIATTIISSIRVKPFMIFFISMCSLMELQGMNATGALLSNRGAIRNHRKLLDMPGETVTGNVSCRQSLSAGGRRMWVLPSRTGRSGALTHHRRRYDLASARRLSVGDCYWGTEACEERAYLFVPRRFEPRVAPGRA